MHDGCNGRFENGSLIVNKLRQMGFSSMLMPTPLKLTCEACEATFTMHTMESSCSNCGMVYGVTPCHATDPASIQPAGVGY
ncbi:MAG: hypothetical protein JXQ81_07590 [Desulfuromonadales bacterium]|nr:hypothetical protein [Desulfuromonadales bacterium]MBN2792349.1 hypothetical protein [Desulfuromonadales bacterium]